MSEEVERLARRLSGDPRITTRTLRRMLKDIDGEIHAVLRAGASVPHVVSNVREVVARAYLLRQELDRARAAETPSS